MLTHRLARHADLDALARLMEAAIAELQKPFLDERQIAASRAIMGLDSQLVEDGTYFLVEEDGEPAGCGGWSRRATLYGSDRTPGRSAALLDPGTDAARIRAMYTHPRHARRGVGRLILSLCEQAARVEGFTRIELMSTLAGEPLYRACGYQPVEWLTDARGGAPVPLLRMVKTLPNRSSLRQNGRDRMREIWVESKGARLFAVEDGSGPVVVMLHGGMADHRAARALVAPLADRCRVVTPDLRGSGRSWCGAPLTFDQLTDDLERLLDQIGASRAIVGGVSSGTGVALRFAMQRPSRVSGLVLVKPVYAGERRGYTDQQKATFAMMDDVASRAVEHGVQALRPLYANLPESMREKAFAMIERFDPASVAATSHFLASGAQPFVAAEDLVAVNVPTLIVRGDDPLHPAAVSADYVAAIPNSTALPASTGDIAAAIGAFGDAVTAHLEGS